MTTAVTELPPAKDVRDLVEGLLGKDCAFSDGRRITAGPALVGVYVSDDLRMRAIAAMDLPLAAYVGAAIGLVPPGGAAAAVEDGELFPNLRDNACEVLNVMAALFNVGDAPHLRLYSTSAPEEALPADVAGHLAALGGRADWTVAVKGYGEGQLSICLT
ncbi:hypothetical protein [Quadrisphaera sp. DSM 44207]|uniref:hypothetical protein n=1 Tax=Quadrisphaera sp. DSM 44207 TaxID=1881057 RepID=UPI00088F7EC6|nr:hypothetical protein [Quadrisphaera sp. DSM 44207]SDQ20509.1 hypothetical protein SAMN05428996_1072 [Quadrisphaera sp. DSM 44207]